MKSRIPKFYCTKRYLITALKYQTVLLKYEIFLIDTEDCGGSVNVCLSFVFVPHRRVFVYSDVTNNLV